MGKQNTGSFVSIQIDPISTGVFFPGQTVSGVVILNSGFLNLSYDKFYVTATGQARLYFPYDAELLPDEVCYPKSEFYLSVEIPLVKENAIFDQVTDRCYLPFSFVLPLQCPPSYVGKHGHVLYSIKVDMKGKDLSLDGFTNEIYFAVRTVVDLSRDDLVSLKPAEYQVLQEYRNGFIKVKARLDKAVYIPGEIMLFRIKIKQNYRAWGRKPVVQFIQYARFTDKKYTHQSKEVLFEKRAEKIDPNYQLIWDVPITVGSVPPTGLPFCSLIDIYYTVKVTIDPGLFKAYLIIPLKVVIGTTRSPIDQQPASNQENQENNSQTETV